MTLLPSSEVVGDLSAAVRSDFPILDRDIDGNRLVYLDNAATSLKPTSVVDAVRHYLQDVGASIHRGKHLLSEQASTAYEGARYRAAQFIGAKSTEVSFVTNTTEALNLVARGMGLDPDDLVVVTSDSHHSNMLPWRRVARVEHVALTATGEPDLQHYEELLRQHPRVAVMNHCSNVTGLYTPVEVMARMAKEAGAVVVVDAAQSAPHRRLDVTALGVDALAFSAHKMLGPPGIGVLYMRDDLARHIEPLALGGGTVDWVDWSSYTLRKCPHRFEAGTPNIAGAYGLVAALDYLDRIGLAAVSGHDAAVAKLLVEAVEARDHLTLVGGGEGGEGDRAGMVSVALAGGVDVGDVARVLSDAHGVMCRTGHMCAQPLVTSFARGPILRISGYIYNSPQDVATVFDALDSFWAASR
jgi:cysteine desulfurase/selenocysteine lyase